MADNETNPYLGDPLKETSSVHQRKIVSFPPILYLLVPNLVFHLSIDSIKGYLLIIGKNNQEPQYYYNDDKIVMIACKA